MITRLATQNTVEAARDSSDAAVSRARIHEKHQKKRRKERSKRGAKMDEVEEHEEHEEPGWLQHFCDITAFLYIFLASFVTHDVWWVPEMRHQDRPRRRRERGHLKQPLHRCLGFRLAGARKMGSRNTEVHDMERPRFVGKVFSILIGTHIKKRGFLVFCFG